MAEILLHSPFRNLGDEIERVAIKRYPTLNLKGVHVVGLQDQGKKLGFAVGKPARVF
jgi:hypothetical protein